MSPRGFYAKEYISPHFTSSEYLKSDQAKVDAATMDRIDKTFDSLIKYPGTLAKRSYIWFLLKAGYLKDINKSSQYKYIKNPWHIFPESGYVLTNQINII